ncbi:MAG: Gx transporter family protein [Actinobacteria bacterium]|nr:MAG: Gx transporter family protein [Actinomycetota bacterium]
MSRSSRLAIFSMFLAFGLILQAVEAIYLPSLPIPGIKLGLANMVVLMMLVYFTPLEIFLHVIARLVLSSLILGSFLGPAFYFSTGGAFLSLIAIVVFHKLLYPRISLIGLSLVGATFHNIGQLTVAFLLVKTAAVYMQLPLLLFASVPMGLIIGIAANYSVERLSKTGQLNHLTIKSG